jgi:hypothetical protein
MRLPAIAALAFGVILAAPMAANASDDATWNHHHRVYHRAYKAARIEGIQPNSSAQVPAKPAPDLFPNIAPYPPGQGDTDGLSRRPDDCNKGCIGGNPS